MTHRSLDAVARAGEAKELDYVHSAFLSGKSGSATQRRLGLVDAFADRSQQLFACERLGQDFLYM
jgi:hypothetical protein